MTGLFNTLTDTAYATKGYADVLAPSAGKSLAFQSIAIGNSCGSSIAAGILEMFHDDMFMVGQFSTADSATAVANLTADITFTDAGATSTRNTNTITIEVAAAAANPTDTVLVEFTGTADDITITVTPNDGTNNSATPVAITTANLRELITTGAITGKNATITDLGSLRTLQTATGGDTTALANGGEGDGVVATFSGGTDSLQTDDTEDAQDVGAGDVPLFTTTDDDGFVIQSFEKFGFVTMSVSTAEAGSPVYTYEYWNGSAYATLATFDVPAAYGTGVNIIAFHQPVDWALGGPSDQGFEDNMYHIRVLATTAPSTAPIASTIKIGRFHDFNEVLDDGEIIEISFEDDYLLFFGGSTLMPYFGTANANNTISAIYREV